jgi:monomeric sarcosine oxidase
LKLIVDTQQVVIVGAGIIGLATAYSLLQQGLKNITVIEQAIVDHARASSHGVSRLLRFEYGPDTFYSDMVQLSLQRWQRLAQRTKRKLYTPTGLLVMGNENDNYTMSSYSTAHAMGLSPQRLTASECAQRYPQFNTQDYNLITFNANAGMLHASTSLQTLRECILGMGGHILEHCRVTNILHNHTTRPIQLETTGEEKITAERVVIATGPWVHRLLSNIDLPVRLTRQYLLYFANLATKKYSIPAFPAFFAGDLYGFPLYKENDNTSFWLKAASHAFGDLTEPDEPDAPDYINEQAIARITQQLYRLLPELSSATLAKIEPYIYDVSTDEHFILDYVPDDQRLVFATGLSGHGFKFGLLLGELLSSLVLEEQPVIPIERFRLARFSHQWSTLAPSVA